MSRIRTEYLDACLSDRLTIAAVRFREEPEEEEDEEEEDEKDEDGEEEDEDDDQNSGYSVSRLVGVVNNETRRLRRSCRRSLGLAAEGISQPHPERRDSGLEDFSPNQSPLQPGDQRRLLLGIFHGVPATKKSVFDISMGPAHIVLYQKNIEAVCSNEAEIRHQIRQTLMRELGHHFGMTEEQLKDV